MNKKTIHYFIKTECGRTKYEYLSQKNGVIATLRLIWFILFATIRDLFIQDPDIK